MLGKKKKTSDDDSVPMNEVDRQQLDVISRILENTQSNIAKALALLKEETVDQTALLASLERVKVASEGTDELAVESPERIVEGVFNGEKMVAGDGREYLVPANYASKSKLVEGDLLKLTISKSGSFIYKQIGPIERQQLVALLVRNDATNDWYAMQDGKRWRLLTAAVTYFHGEPGDEVVILVPKQSHSSWAAIENIIKKAH